MDRMISWEELNELADGYEGEIPLINVNHSRFFNPVRMSAEIWDSLTETGQVQGGT